MTGKAGRLRHRITIEQPTLTRGSMGGQVESWSTLATVWAAVEALTSTEYLKADEHGGETRHRFTLRHRGDVNKKMRINWDSRVFVIESLVDVNERGRWLQIEAVERD